MNIEDVMVEKVITVQADATAREAVELMNKQDIGSLIVEENEKPVGIVTERDLLKRVLASSRAPEKIRVQEIMSTPLVVTQSHMEIEEAAKLMVNMKVKKLPVVENERLVGLVTLTDLIRTQPHMIRVLREITTAEYTPKRMKKVIDYYVDLPLVSPKQLEAQQKRIKIE
ncbi:MAG: CBS domain-containing protein [Thermoproteota archaeon]|nr:CBS domain-containing protein [Thermoproteota archaeon]